jgi:hypothetical protein
MEESRLMASWAVSASRGKGTLGCFFGVLMIVAVAYGAYKFASPYVRHYQLKDEIQEIATLSGAGALPRVGATSARVTPSVTDIQDAVMWKARELGIPLHRQDIDVHIREEKVFIAVKYSVPIDLPWGTYDFRFEFASHN